MKYLRRFNENNQDGKYYHLYLHPCSTSVLYYFIPDEFNDILKSDKDFEIGFYETNFNDYLNKVYDQERHGSLRGENYIQYKGKEKLNIEPDEHNIYKYKDMYYYEYDGSDIPDNLKIFFNSYE